MGRYSRLRRSRRLEEHKRAIGGHTQRPPKLVSKLNYSKLRKVWEFKKQLTVKPVSVRKIRVRRPLVPSRIKNTKEETMIDEGILSPP